MSYIHLLPTVCNCMHTFEVFVMWDVERIKRLWGRIICLMLIHKNYSFLLCVSIFWEDVVNWFAAWGFSGKCHTWCHCCVTALFFGWWVQLNQVRGIYRLRLISGLSGCYLAHLNLMSFVPTKPFLLCESLFFSVRRIHMGNKALLQWTEFHMKRLKSQNWTSSHQGGLPNRGFVPNLKLFSEQA